MKNKLNFKEHIFNLFGGQIPELQTSLDSVVPGQHLRHQVILLPRRDVNRIKNSNTSNSFNFHFRCFKRFNKRRRNR